jgi:hypothetical protein
MRTGDDKKTQWPNLRAKFPGLELYGSPHLLSHILSISMELYGSPHLVVPYTFHIYGNYMVVHTWLSHIVPISMGIVW